VILFPKVIHHSKTNRIERATFSGVNSQVIVRAPPLVIEMRLRLIVNASESGKARSIQTLDSKSHSWCEPDNQRCDGLS